MALVDDVKVALRVSSPKFDTEVLMLVEAALRDLRRVGVPEDLLYEGVQDPLVKMAVVLYAKAHFGYDNSEASRFDQSYRQVVVDLLNSPTQYGGGCDEVELDCDAGVAADPAAAS